MKTAIPFSGGSMAISFTTACATSRGSKLWSRKLMERKLSRRNEDRQWNRRSRETSTGGSGSRLGRSAVGERGREPINFFADLKRRNVYKIAVAYAVISWLLIQAAS